MKYKLHYRIVIKTKEAGLTAFFSRLFGSGGYMLEEFDFVRECSSNALPNVGHLMSISTLALEGARQPFLKKKWLPVTDIFHVVDGFDGHQTCHIKHCVLIETCWDWTRLDVVEGRVQGEIRHCLQDALREEGFSFSK